MQRFLHTMKILDYNKGDNQNRDTQSREGKMSSDPDS